MTKVVSDNEASSTTFCSTCGNYCQEEADHKVGDRLESIFFQCFSSKSGLTHKNDSKNIVIQFCTTCNKLLLEWDRIMKSVSELINQANRIKLALAVKILEGCAFARSPTGDAFQKIINSKRSDISLRKLGQIKRRIRKEYNCHVVLKNLDMKQSLDQDSEEAGKEIKTEIVANKTFFEDGALDELLLPDPPDQLSDNAEDDRVIYMGVDNETERISSTEFTSRSESPLRKRPRRTARQYQGLKDNDAESEASERDQGFKADGSSCDSGPGESIHTTKNPKKLTNETIQSKKSRKLSVCTLEVGPNEYLYKGEFRFTIGDNGNYYCGHCKGNTSTRTLIYDHIRRHHTLDGKVPPLTNPDMEQISLTEFTFLKKYPFRLDPSVNVYHCGVCENTFSSKSAVTYHMKDAHLTEYEKNLFHCIQISPNEFLFGGKYKIICDGVRFRCAICGYDSDTRHGLYFHIRRFHALQELLPAENSDEMVANSESVETARAAAVNVSEPLSEETNAIDQKVGENMQKTCVKIGPNEYLYDNRIKLIVKGDKWICGRCNLSYETVSKLTTHISSRHKKESKSLEWNHLGDGKYSLGEYKVEHDGKLYKCLTCGRTDKNRRLMFVHVRQIHVNPKPCRVLKDAQQFKFKGVPYSYDASLTKYVCGVCPRFLGERNKLRRHIQTCHLDVERKKFICDICGLQLTAKLSLKFHRQLHEGSNEFVCAECGKGFKLLKYLKDHQRIHRGDDEKKFQCEFCGKKYWTRKEIRNHVTTHTNERPFPCNYCNLSFANTFQRRKHSKAVHNGLPFQK